MAKRSNVPTEGRDKAVSKKVRFDVFERDRFACQYCGRTPPEVLLECDHIQALAKGGRTTIDNLITACEDCNRGKSDRELGAVAPRPDCDVMYLKTMQEVAELQRFQSTMSARDKAQSEICGMITQKAYSLTDDEWAPTESVLLQMLGRYDPDVVYQAVSVVAKRIDDGLLPKRPSSWMPYLWGVAKRTDQRTEANCQEDEVEKVKRLLLEECARYKPFVVDALTSLDASRAWLYIEERGEGEIIVGAVDNHDKWWKVEPPGHTCLSLMAYPETNLKDIKDLVRRLYSCLESFSLGDGWLKLPKEAVESVITFTDSTGMYIDPRRSVEGHVYLLESLEDPGVFKIEVANVLTESRMSAIQKQHPFALQCVARRHSSDIYEEKFAWDEYFSGVRDEWGKWFVLDAAAIEEFRSRPEMKVAL